ncbi:MATE family efflux transporter [Alkaliphilus oremlandii]|uniref:MATE efflux family protein n=1 Tax=Alkaliphilus oremlandii (strain OhILAs) TaxID=350688 RepID=A8ML76_ALKOO|nr:MATE family efflux transporter [Alkaliphilus oremlandii]ABW17893.1 MATE efflux family protein [Alkaliphilus oremlandii OhILAs]
MNIEKVHGSKLGNSSFYNTLLKLAIPIVVQNFITSSINMVDTLMIGKVGEIEIAAVGIANQYFFLFNILLVGITSGSGIFLSQYWGKKDIKNIRKILGISLISSVIASILFTIIALIAPSGIIRLFNKDPYVIQLGVDYLLIVCFSYIFTAISMAFGVASRSVEDSVAPMLVSILALLTNATLNYAFIFGHFGFPVMGVKGAALATLIARVVEAIALVLYLYGKKSPLAAKLKEMVDSNAEFIKRAMRTILPVVINDFCWAIAAVIYSICYGSLGTQAMASIQITTTVQNTFMVLSFGIANGSAVMIGNKVGAGDLEEAEEYTKKFLKISMLSGLLIGLLMSSSSKIVLSFFNVSAEVHTSALRILYINSAIMFLKVLGIVIIVGILRGGGDASYALKVEMFTMWLVGVPLALLGAFVFKLPVEIVVFLVGFEEAAKVFFSMRRLKTNLWIKQVTE